MTTLKTSAAEKELVETARRVLPAGTFGNVDGEMVVKEGKGGRVWDVSGNRFVDFFLGSGPMLLGHAHPEVTAAVKEQLDRGTTFFVNNEYGIRLAAEIVDAMACAEQVRFCCSGTEADAYAIRLVRAYRKRSKIMKFEGGYHGMSDYGLMSTAPTRSSNSSHPIPDSAGIPASVEEEMIVAPFNDLAAAEELISRHHDELAGVIVEPQQRVLPPQKGFLEGLRAVTTKFGVPLVFDEVVTGFRLAYGGAQEYYGVVPDVCTLGKIVGGGYPLSAVAGRAEIMAHFDKSKVGALGFLPQYGTLSGNPVAAVAGIATLNILKRPGTYERLRKTGNTLQMGLTEALNDVGIPAMVRGEAAMFDIYFTDLKKIENYRDTLTNDMDIYTRFSEILHQRGLLKGVGKFYVSLAHDDEDIEQAIGAFKAAAQVVAEEFSSKRKTTH